MILQYLINIMISYVIGQFTESYNFPMQVGQPNQIYLEDYIPNQYQGSSYQFISNNDFNLTLIQSVEEILSNLTTLNDDIQCVSNYILESQLYTNVFWVLTNSNQLYTGIIDQQGVPNMTKLNIHITADYCYNINLIDENNGVLTCSVQNNLSFISINALKSDVQYYNTYNQTSNTLQTFIYINEQNYYSINVALINGTSTQILNYFVLNNSLAYNSSTTIYGNFYQVYASRDLNFIFLLSNTYIQIFDQQLEFQKRLLNFQGEQPFQMTIYQISEHTFRLALLNQQLIQLYLIQTQLNYYTTLSSQIYIQTPQNISIFNMIQEKMFIIANNYLCVLDLTIDVLQNPQYINLQSYLSINLNISQSIINFDRSIAVIFSSNNSLLQIQSFMFTNPQILITANQQSQISTYGNTYQLNISVNPQLSQLQTFYIILNILTVDYTVSQCAVQKFVNLPDLTIQYPDYTIIPVSNIFQGPFISQSITTSQTDILEVNSTYQGNPGSFIFQTQTFQVLCTYQETIPIYCSQYQNQSIIITKFFQTTYPIIINSQENITSCKCYVKEQNMIDVVLQFSQQIIVQQIKPLFQQGQQISYNFNQTILSSAILKNSLFTITQDNTLFIYNIATNPQLLNSVGGQQFKNIYVNNVCFPNLLFIDNTTNVVILSYQGSYSYTLLNNLYYPITTYNQISLGITQNGLYLAYLLNSNSSLYFYSKSNFYIQNTNLQTYYQIPLLSYQIYGPNILSSYTKTHFYLITQIRNSYYILTFTGSGSAFNQLTFHQNLGSSCFSGINAATQPGYQIDMVQAYCNIRSQSFNYTVPINQSFNLVPMFVSTNTLEIQFYVNYTNAQCKQNVTQSVSIRYDEKQIIQPLNYTKLNYTIFEQSYIRIDPTNLFTGNIFSYSSLCNNCSRYYDQYPISQNVLTLNFTYQAAMQLNGNLIIQTNEFVFFINEYGVFYNYTIPGQNQTCNYMFQDISSKLLVSVCSQNNITNFYAFNTSNISSAIISFQYQFPYPLFKSNYNNGILQTMLYSKNFYSYYSFYFWIVKQTINLQLIYSMNLMFRNSYFEFIILQQSTNFSSEPCQIVGFTTMMNSSTQIDPDFYIFKFCMSSNLSQIFGFPTNNYTNNTLLYFANYYWNLLVALPPFYWSFFDIIQVNVGQLITDNVILAQFIVPMMSQAFKYNLLFNASTGNLISFWQINSFYTINFVYTPQYQMFQSQNGPIASLQGEQNSSEVNLCVYPNKISLKNKNEILYTIGCVSFNQFNVSLNRRIVGDYFLLVDNSTGNTIVYNLSSQIYLYINITGYNTSQYTLTAYNLFGQTSQQFNIENSQYIYPDDNNDDNNYHPGGNSEDDGTDIRIELIIGLSLGVIAILIIVSFIIVYYKRQKQQLLLQQQSSSQNQPFYEMQ